MPNLFLRTCTVFLPRLTLLMSVAACVSQPGWQRPDQPVATPAGLIDAADPQRISEIAARYGEAFWERDGFRDPRIRAVASGVPYIVEFYGCKEGRDCRDLRLLAKAEPQSDGKPRLTGSEIAKWNHQNRFGKLTMDDQNTTFLEMNLQLGGGVTRQNLDLSFDWWVVALREFSEATDIERKNTVNKGAVVAQKKLKNRP